MKEEFGSTPFKVKRIRGNKLEMLGFCGKRITLVITLRKDDDSFGIWPEEHYFYSDLVKFFDEKDIQIQ